MDRMITTLHSEVYRWEVFQNLLFSIRDFNETVKLSRCTTKKLFGSMNFIEHGTQRQYKPIRISS